MVLTERDPKAYWPSCEHGDGELRTQIAANGIKHFKFECQSCGRRGSSIARVHWIVGSLTEDPPEIDEDISRRYWEAESVRRQNERDAESREWWDWYSQYLDSEEWRQKADRVLFRDGGKCMAVLDGCQRRASHVHHLTYKHVGNEPLFDLISVCPSCHEQITAMDRERKGAA